MWLRTSAGYSHGDRDEPLANFYFGGFGNNWVDHRTEKRYRKFYAFPGTELNEISGTDYGKVLVEGLLPPVRFGRFGFPALYASWARVAVFSTALVTNMGSHSSERTYANFGAQIDVRMQMLSHLKLTFSGGYAVAFEKGNSGTDEVMFSLRLL